MSTRGSGALAVLWLVACHALLPAADLASFESLHDFKRSTGDGEYPYDSVTEGSDGWLYGTTLNGGGPEDGGLVFRLEKSGKNYQVLHLFGPLTTTNGLSPWGGVIEGTDGRLYGATRHGGAELVGLIYSLARDGADFRIIHSFSASGPFGRYPMNSVIQARDGRLYGRTLSGGQNDAATVFGLNPDGSDFQVLHSFEQSQADYIIPYSGLLEGSDGWLYGTTPGEGPAGAGSVFRIRRDGSEFQTLHFFSGTGKGPEGRVPDAGVTESSDGVLYGTTEGGGFDDFGVLYRVNRDGTGYRVLHEFTAQGGQGYSPTSAPIEGPDGALYGTTHFGGPEDTGTIFRIQKDGTALTFFYTFGGTNCPAYPYAALRLGRDGAFYGTAYNGLDEIYGAVFRVNPIALVPASGVVRLHAMAGQSYALETANDLTEAWSEQGRQTNLTGTLEFPVPPGATPRFYRARLVPP